MDDSDFYIRRLDFPNRSVKAITFPNDDGTFDIYLNTLYPESELQTALAHELRHIRLGHFYSDAPIAQKEAEADGKPAAPSVRSIPLFNTPQELGKWMK
ncbi:MAG: hypothetical protein LUC89_01115 [Oscillospiraceae bacterium]|nr:hypothetical protein [Oscillospiraceae bacterium]